MNKTTANALENVFVGMSKAEFFGCTMLILGSFALALWILNYVFNLKMAKFAEMSEDVKEIRRKVKSGDELKSIARDEVADHERRYHNKIF